MRYMGGNGTPIGAPVDFMRFVVARADLIRRRNRLMDRLTTPQLGPTDQNNFGLSPFDICDELVRSLPIPQLLRRTIAGSISRNNRNVIAENH
ncbi:hypothetical protein ASG42_11630 [Rhizobium sp. Leaf391]|nr:hypothetical protein ASG42_11630 [Rhizobium sp. Leaf391]